MTEPASDPWYRTFFERDYYDTFYAPLRKQLGRLSDDASERETEFIIDALQLSAGARVLDLCCGPGRHSIVLANRGFEVTGLDLSAYHIELARKAASGAGVDAEFIVDDMRNLPVSPPFDAIVNIFTSFGYLESEADDAAVIARVASALKPGGLFMIDVNNAVRTLRNFDRSMVTREHDGTLLIEERQYDLLTGRIDSIWTFVSSDGQRRERDIHVRAYTPAELRAMLDAAGLRVVASYGDFDGSALEMDSRRAILVAEK